MASVCAGTLALMDAGVPVKTPVAGISIGLVTGDGQSASGVKALRIADRHHWFRGSFWRMDFKLCGNERASPGFQLDLKLPGISHKIMAEAVQRAKEARTKILGFMASALEKPRAELSRYRPADRDDQN